MLPSTGALPVYDDDTRWMTQFNSADLCCIYNTTYNSCFRKIPRRRLLKGTLFLREARASVRIVCELIAICAQGVAFSEGLDDA